MERAGQGADRIFEESIWQGKSLPDFTHTDEHEVVLTLDGQIQDESFLRFLEKIGHERLASFNTEDFIVLDLVHKDRPMPPTPTELRFRLNHLVDLGIVERIGKGRAARHILCQQYYTLAGKNGMYTRKRGLDKETNKELLVKHISLNAKHGSKLAELNQVLPFLSQRQVQELLRELRIQKQIHFKGQTKASLWFPGSS